MNSAPPGRAHGAQHNDDAANMDDDDDADLAKSLNWNLLPWQSARESKFRKGL